MAYTRWILRCNCIKIAFYGYVLNQYPNPTRKLYDLRDGRISAVHFGLASNPVKLLLVHANGFNGYAYKTLLQPLGVHAIALDLRGHGMSELPVPEGTLRSWSVFRDDVTEFIERYIDRPVVVAGHSFGAVSAILAMPQIKQKVSGYVGFDPVLPPWLFRQIPKLPGGPQYMQKRIKIARNAGRRKFVFDSLETAFKRYKDRGAFRGFTDEALRNYLTGGLVQHEDGVQLACHPLWEQKIFTGQGNDTFKAAKHLPLENSHITFAGMHGAVSFRSGRKAMANIIGVENVIYDKSRAHMFPMHDPDYAMERLKTALSKMALA